jgi:ABC-type lipoprotein release transport system permease subunit
MVRQRRQEIGVRLALGAEPADILRSVLAHGGKLLAAGGVLGLAGSFAATRVLESYLFQVSDRLENLLPRRRSAGRRRGLGLLLARPARQPHRPAPRLAA